MKEIKFKDIKASKTPPTRVGGNKNGENYFNDRHIFWKYLDFFVEKTARLVCIIQISCLLFIMIIMAIQK